MFSSGTKPPGVPSTSGSFGRPGTSRPVTALGRLVRLGTASMLSESGGPFIRVDRLDLRERERGLSVIPDGPGAGRGS